MTALTATYLFLLGAVVGSFLNVCIHRLPRAESVIRPRSNCPSCRKTITVFHNIPLVSYLFLRGRCGACGWRIPARYPLVEFTTAVLFAGGYLRFMADPRFAVFLPFVAICVALFVIDAEHQLLPDLLTLPGCAIGLLLSPWNPLVGPRGALLGAFVGASLSAGLILVYWWVRKRQGMGWGDVKMLAMIGAFLGWDFTLLTIVLGSFLGIAWWGLQEIRGKGRGLQHVLPFGSFLALGSIACLLFGQPILIWYRSLLLGSVAGGLAVLP